MKTKFAIGCLVQWYESDTLNELDWQPKDRLKEHIKNIK